MGQERTEADRLGRGSAGLHEVHRLTPGPLRVGTEHDFVRRFAAFEFPQGSITGRGSYRVEPDGHGGSLLTGRVELEPKGVMRLAQPVLARVLRRDVRRDDQALRTLLERPPGPVQPPASNGDDAAGR